MLCSFLLLEDASLDSPLNLADKSLQSLSLKENQDSVNRARSLQKLASLTALTRMELEAQLVDQEEEIAALRNLQLQELALLNCAGLELRLLVPGALTRLRKLHIEEKKLLLGNYTRNPLLCDEEREQLKATGEVVFQLKGLSQISGLCNLFAIGMRQGLKEWEEAAFSEGTMVSKITTHCCPPHLMKLWTKSRS